jgi:hypothetical protein
MKLGQYFYLSEFLRSGTAVRHGIDMTPPPEVINNLKRLVNDVLDPLRHALGQPVVITSGYRPEALNKIVGGVSTSYHRLGLAADIVVPGVMPYNVLHKMRSLKLKALDQVIDEFNQWSHIQIAPPNGQLPRGLYNIARKQGGKTVYETFR